MDKNASCPQCGNEVPELFCICTDLEPMGLECWAKHNLNAGFHFALPLAAKDFVNARNQRDYKHWLINLSDSQAKLKGNVPAVDKCFADIKLGYEGMIQEMVNTKDRVLGQVLQFKAAFAAAVDQAIKETSLNAYCSDYQPTTYLAWLVWNHSCANSPEDIKAFSYEVKSTDERLRDPLEVVVQNTVPELAPLAYTSGGSQIMKELQDLRSANRELIVNPVVVQKPFVSWENPQHEEPQVARKLSQEDELPPEPALTKALSSDMRAAEARVHDDRSPAFSWQQSKPDHEKQQAERVEESKKLPSTAAMRQDRTDPHQARAGSQQLAARAKQGPVRQEKCIDCGKKHEIEDRPYLCPGACRCKRCLVEAVTGTEVNICKYCRQSIDSVLKTVKNLWRRCDVCEIVLEFKDMARMAAHCSVCWQCVVPVISKVATDTGFKGVCRLHSPRVFDLDKTVYEMKLMRNQSYACCHVGILEGEKLPCGHFICSLHQPKLKFCRSCHVPAGSSESQHDPRSGGLRRQ